MNIIDDLQKHNKLLGLRYDQLCVLTFQSGQKVDLRSLIQLIDLCVAGFAGSRPATSRNPLNTA